jgi:hypothetical protein
MIERSEELKLFDLGPIESVLERNAGHHGRPKPGLSSVSGCRCLERSAVRPDPPHPRVARRGPAGRGGCGQLDTFETHGTRAAFERDRLRQEELKLAGVEMIRVTGARLDREPDRVLERVAMLLETRAETTGRKPT